MQRHRHHGEPSYRVAVVHGGPGAVGEMEPVARALAPRAGVVEPFHLATTIDKQVEELVECLERHANPPATVIGHSWGAWLAFITAALHPAVIEQLVLVSSGPFEARHVRGITTTRVERLDPDEAKEFTSIINAFSTGQVNEPARAWHRLGQLALKSDSFELVHDQEDENDITKETNLEPAQRFARLMEEGNKLRRSGKLVALGNQIRCPVIAIHGDHDPHPAAGVQEPLARIVRDFKFILLERCGHVPWRERHAKDAFFRILLELCS